MSIGCRCAASQSKETLTEAQRLEEPWQLCEKSYCSILSMASCDDRPYARVAEFDQLPQFGQSGLGGRADASQRSCCWQLCRLIALQLLNESRYGGRSSGAHRGQYSAASHSWSPH